MENISETFEMVGDPGHDKDNRHNVGPTGYVEADGVLIITEALKEQIEKYKNVNFVMTRDKDKVMKLRPRGNMAAGKDLFISNHTNAGPRTARGVEVFYSVDLPNDKELANKIAAAIAEHFNVPNRGAKLRPGKNNPDEDYYSVIDAAQDSGCKHVFLVEALFHSNEEDEAILKQESNLKKIGEIEGKVVADHFNLELKEQETWQEVIKNVSSNPEEWIKVIEAMVIMANDKINIGDFEILKYLPDLILKLNEGS